MRTSKAWTIARKDIKVILRKRHALATLIVFPVFISLGLPEVLHLVAVKITGAGELSALLDVMTAFSFFWVIGAAVLPTVLASYSLVGEKAERSLEPLLAAPITDRQLLLGKGIGALIPSAAALYIGILVFVILADAATRPVIGYDYFPNWTLGLIVLVLIPLTLVLSVAWSVIVSSRASDPRAAQLQGFLLVLPLGAIYVAVEIGALTLDNAFLGIMSGVILVLDVILYFLSARVLQREEILTKWK